MKDPACRTDGLSVAYHAEAVLRNVDFAAVPGTVMGIVGPNGAGKSTLIKAMLGLVPTLTGTTTFFGQPLKAVRNRVGYMPQTTSVDWDFPTTVRDVVLMGTYGRRGWLRRPTAAHRQAAEHAIAHVDMSDFADRQIGELSGGQRQRVFLARALAQEADLYFMDEPFAGIDATTERAILAVLRDLRNEGKTVVLVHHDLLTVKSHCDDVTLLNRSVVASGPVDEVFTDAAIRTTYGVTATEVLDVDA